MTGFWRTWMTVWVVGVVLFGIILAGAATEATTGPLRLFFSAVLHDPLSAEPGREFRFITALLGAVSIGWGLTYYAVLRVADTVEAAIAGRLWRGLTAGLLAWFVIDSTLSIMTGYPLNAVSNVVLFGAYMVPMLASGVLARRA